MKKLISALLCLSIMLTGCATASATEDLMSGITARELDVSGDMESGKTAVMDAALNLYRVCGGTDNTLISPVSILSALGMTANGAAGTTKSEMEDVFGMTTGEMNEYLLTWRKGLPESKKNLTLHTANSIWFKDTGFTINQDFAQTNADYYDADLYAAPFDNSTVSDINSWVNENTDEMVPEIIDQLPVDAVMCLINAVAFEAAWSDEFEESATYNGTFTREDGTEDDASFMVSSESVYLEGENCTGCFKYYKGGRYVFAALLPNEGVTVESLIDSLDGQELCRVLEDTAYASVRLELPKFEYDWSVDLATPLKELGVTTAFDSDLADLSGCGTADDGNLYISKVIHKTHIEVDEQGTKAAAATAVMVTAESAPMEDDELEYREVILDRPFVYFILDTQTTTPLFMGSVMSVSAG